jgi:glutathione S-transferase
MSITLYYAPQSNGVRIYASLEELGVPHEKVKIDLRAGDQKKPEFLALNPNGKVPTIVLDGTPMFESVAIQIALGERYGVEKGLWPALGSPEHLSALTWIVWGQVALGTAVSRYMQNTSDYFPKELHHAGQAEAALKETHTLHAILDAHLATHAYLAGERFTLADLDLASVLGWAVHASKISLAACPKVAAWLGTVSQRPGMRAAMAAV